METYAPPLILMEFKIHHKYADAAISNQGEGSWRGVSRIHHKASMKSSLDRLVPYWDLGKW